MSNRASLAVLALISCAGGIACATSTDPGGGGTFDSGTHADSSVAFDTKAALDSETPGSDSTSATDSGTTKEDTSIVTEDTGSTKIDSGTTVVDTGSLGDTFIGPDSFVPTDTFTPPVDSGVPPVDSGVPTSGVGSPCTSDLTCDPTGLGEGYCSSDFFALGPVDPSPVCIGYDMSDCDLDDGTSILYCDGTQGVCLASGTAEICLPACVFDNTGAAPTGCVGKDVCNAYGFGRSSTGTPTGVGYCFGGCKVDADCPSPSKCQVEEGLCVDTKVTYTKTVGTACTKAADAGTVPTCNCLYVTSTNKGYCTNACTVGSSTCAAGFKCSPELPTTDATGAMFTTDPTGMGGNCLKSCATDTDCTSINAKCKDTATGKVCVPG